MNFVVSFLAFAIAVNLQIGVVHSIEDGIRITDYNLPSKSRTSRIAAETWPKLEFMIDDTNANIEKWTQAFKKLPIVQAERQIADFWKNFGKPSAVVKMESEVLPTLKTTAKPKPSSPQVNSDNGDEKSPVANQEEETTDNSKDLTLVNTEDENPLDIGLRSSQNAPENAHVPSVGEQGLPPYTPPENEYIDPVQYAYPNPQRVYYQPYNFNLPGVYPSQIMTQPNLPFGYPQSVPVNQFYMPHNPYTIPQFYQPGINLPPNYQPYINRMGARRGPILYPTYSNMEPQPQ